jgi:FkbM family methyltransferase
MNIVNIGCNDGDDHVLAFCKKNRDKLSKVLMVEPSVDKLNECMQNYAGIENVYFIDKAITVDNNNELTLYVDSNCSMGHHTSFRKEHLQAHNHTEITAQEFPAININNLFEEHGLETIDRLYIDVEGYDVDIVNSIDFDKYKVNRIRFEATHTHAPNVPNCPKLINTLQNLQKLGYRFLESPASTSGSFEIICTTLKELPPKDADCYE